MNPTRTSPLPPHPNAEAMKYIYRNEVLGLPGPLDRWLTANKRAAGISFLTNYLLLHDLSRVENVVCRVQRRCQEAEQDDTDFANPPTYTLYLTCMIASLKVPVHHRKSPTVFLDRYVGSPEELTAPDWVGWAKPTLDFYQPRAAIAETFARLSALWENRRQPGLQKNMLEWARAVSVDLWLIHDEQEDEQHRRKRARTLVERENLIGEPVVDVSAK